VLVSPGRVAPVNALTRRDGGMWRERSAGPPRPAPADPARRL